MKTEVPVQYHRNVVDRHRLDVNPDLYRYRYFLLLFTAVPVYIFLSFSSASKMHNVQYFVPSLEIFGKSIAKFTFVTYIVYGSGSAGPGYGT